MRKKLGLFLATVLAFSAIATGCGKTATPAQPAAENNNEVVAESKEETTAASKIVIFQSKTEIQDALANAVKDFTNETGIEVEIWETTGDDYQQQLEGKLANNQGPTIFTQLSGTNLVRLQDYCADLSGMDMFKNISTGLTAGITIGDKVMGVPYTMEGFGIVYNKDLVDATTLNSVDAFAAKLAELKGQGVQGFELTQESYFLIGHILNTPFAVLDDSDAFIAKLATGEAKMADEESFQELGKVMEAIRDNCQNPLGQNYDGQIGDLCTGKAAMIHQGNWCAGMFADYNFTNAALAPLPICGNDKISVSVPYYWAVNATASAEEQEAAKTFLNWLYTSETGKNYLYNEFLFIPVINGDVNENLDVLSQSMQEYVANNKIMGWNMDKWPAGSIDVNFLPVAQAFFNGDIATGADFIDALDAAYAEAVANAN